MNNDWKIIEGKNPILFVAQHALPQLRDQIIKPEDMLTGLISEMLAEKMGGFSITTTQIQQDPNWYENSPFRKKVFEIIKSNNIKLVIDIHGRKMNSENKREIFPNKTFKENHKVDLGEDWKIMEFKDNYQLTLSEDLGRAGVPSVELELRLDVRQSILSGRDKSIEELVLKIGI